MSRAEIKKQRKETVRRWHFSRAVLKQYTVRLPNLNPPTRLRFFRYPTHAPAALAGRTYTELRPVQPLPLP